MNLEEYKRKFNFRTVRNCKSCRWLSINGAICRHPECPYQQIPFGGYVENPQILYVHAFRNDQEAFVCDNWENGNR